MQDLEIGDILKNPKFAIKILQALDEQAKNNLLEVFPFIKFSLNVVLNQPNNLETVRELFGLYPDRTKGKRKLVYAVCHAGGRGYTPLENGTNVHNTKNTTGFLVVIPVPYENDYTKVSDQQPIKLIQMYISAISKLNPACNKMSESEKLIYVSSRLRIILGLNLKDDHRNNSTHQSSWKNRQRVLESAERLNQEIIKNNYPAWVIPLVWGVDFVKGKEVYHKYFEFRWLNSTADQIREYLRLLSDNVNEPSLKFPYATVRSFLIENAASLQMLNELKARCQTVFYCSGDADLVSLSPESPNMSVFNVIFKELSEQSGVGENITRLGGSYGFDNEDIGKNIISLMSGYNIELPQLYIQKSVLLTQLVRIVDICTRKIMSTIEADLAYFSEAHCYLNTDLFADGSCQLRNSKLSMPDVTSELTRVIKNKKKSHSKSGNGETSNQLFFAQRSAQLLTSSRKNTVVVFPNTSKIPDFKKGDGKIIEERNLNSNYEVIKNIVTTLHNTQVRAGQLNARFSEAGYGKDGFHVLVKELPTNFFPFIKFFFAEKEQCDIALRQIANINLKPEYYLGSQDMPTTFQSLLSIIIYHTENDSLINVNPEVRQKLGPIYKDILEKLTNVKSKQNLSVILDAFCRIETLLRWLFVMTKLIGEFAHGKEFCQKYQSTVDSISSTMESWSDQINEDVASMFYGMTRAILDTNNISHSDKQQLITNSLQMFASKTTHQNLSTERNIEFTVYI